MPAKITRPEIASSVTTGSFTTNYHDVGSGEPILLLHGSGPGVSAWANWGKTFPLLRKHFRLLAPDMAGFGYTERVPGAVYSLDGWLQQVIEFLDALEIGHAHIVGNSFGGALAIALAVKYPQRVDKLVLMGAMGVSFPITDGLNKVWGYTPSPENMAGLLQIFTYDHSFATPELAESRYQSSMQPGFQESYGSMFPEPRQAGVEMMAAYESQIGDIQNDALVIHGLQDKVIPVTNSLKLLNMLPNAQLHIFGRCGHWTQIEHTEQFCDQVRDFLKR